MPILTCQRCGKPFEARTRRAKICPGRCYRAHEAESSKRARALYSEERRRASVLTGCAIASGLLVRQPCEVCGCGRRKADAHHDDYSRPLEVRWLCRSHHRQHHVRLNREQCSPATRGSPNNREHAVPMRTFLHSENS
jgi:hypothetical protein